ncbi:MAG: hypothetical protein K2K87_14600 [Lachnospiraceae bacterium]|nr:hypothetical protein [Lachnospiraceae bacterium]
MEIDKDKRERAMKDVLNMIVDLKNNLQMDANSFYPMLIAAIVPLSTLSDSVLMKIKEHKEKRIFEMYKRTESDNFYIFIMIGELVILFFNLFFTVFIYEMIRSALVKISDEVKTGMVLQAMILVAVSIGTGNIIFNMKWVKKRLIGDRAGKLIIFCSVTIVDVFGFLLIVNELHSCLHDIFVISYLFFEIIGLLYFQGRYTKYDYSSIKLYLDNGECITCENIENIRIKKNFAVAEVDGKCIVLQYQKIARVEYYGPQKFILKENIFSKYVEKFIDRRKKRSVNKRY